MKKKIEVKKNVLPELSVFFPCYNEEKNITATFEKALPIIKKYAKKWEILLINDGSKDNTLEVIKKLAHKYGPNIKVLNHPINRGYGAALKSGFYNSKYEWIVFTDSDGQFDFKDFKKFLIKQKQSNSDLVIGYYLGRKVPFYRKWGSFVWQLAVYFLFGLKVRDIDCGFKLIRKKVIDTIPKLESERGPFITSEFLIQSQKSGFKISEIGVHHFSRQEGSATGSNLNVIFAGLKDLLRLRQKINSQK